MDKFLIIVPCYNEADRLPTQEYKDFWSKQNNQQFDFLFVSDGSTDNTVSILEELTKDNAQSSVLAFTSNQGKAEAIRSAILEKIESNYQYIGFIDADLAIPLDELNHFVQLKENKDYYLISAARVQLLGYSDIKKTLIRHLIGRTFATVVSSMLALPVYDTQCGAKLYKKDMIKDIFSERFSSKWLFDVEILFRMKKQIPDYQNKILEVPLRKCINPDGSKISFWYYLKAPLDLLKIYFRYR